jgi:hypothetical protein
MGKKKKQIKKKYTFICEGQREFFLLKYLATRQYFDVWLSDKINKIISCRGGSADSIVLDAIKFSHTFPNLVVVFDQDFQERAPISDDTFDKLQQLWKIDDSLKGVDYKDLLSKNPTNRNPILIVSHPCSIEGFILRVFGREYESLNGKSTKQLKGEVVTLMNEVLENVDMDKEVKDLDGLTPDLQKYCVFLIKSDFLQKMCDARHRVPECDILLKLFDIN